MGGGGAILALTAGDEWLLAFAISTLAVLAGCAVTRRRAHVARGKARRGLAPARRGMRHRAGALMALGPVLGFLSSPSLGEHALIVALGAVVLAAFGAAIERRDDADRLVLLGVAVVSIAAVAAGVRLEPTGVGFFDILGGIAVIAVVTAVVDGLGNANGLVPGIGGGAALGVFGLAAFAGQDPLAAVAAGLGGACVAFLVFNLPPASLYAGRGGRLAVGYTVAVSALSVHVPASAASQLFVPLLLLGLLLLDGALVSIDRLRRGRRLLVRRRDHLVHRLTALRWSAGEATAILVVAQFVLSVLAVFAGRAAIALWLSLLVGALVLAAIGREAGRAPLDRERPRGFSRRVRIGAGIVGLAAAVSILPSVLVAPDVRDLMERGRTAATRALAAAREGDDANAELGFRQAAAAFEEAHDKLTSPTQVGGLAVPGLAPNVQAARALADIGQELARAGERVTAAVDPERLEVIDGRLPLEEVRRVAPELDRGARTLDRAVEQLRAIDRLYLASIVGDALDDLESELSQARGEADRAAAAARLAPAIFGGDDPRTYLLVVQNNAELRATGGLIGNWGLLRAVDGDVSIDRLQRTAAWNNALDAVANPTIDAPPDYHRRYDRQGPERGLQSVNLSPDFPTVARVLESVAPQIGLPELDGVVAVDPLGLAALLELTGPVRVAGWPEDVTADNIVDVTLRDAYAAFEETPERAEFLGDVAEVVVDVATETNLGAPARIAKVLGAAAHEGHLLLSFTRPEEQALAEQLDVAGELGPVRSDALLVNTQNAGANKIDYYLDRRIDYRVRVSPDPGKRTARVETRLTVRLENTAPAAGLPQIVIGPFADGFVAGENRSYVSVYTGLDLRSATVDGAPVGIATQREVSRRVVSLGVAIPATSTRTVTLTFAGRVRLRAGGWYELDLGHQPTLEPDRVQVSVEVPDGWEVADAPGLVTPFDRRASGVLLLERNRRVRVRIARKPPPLDLWGHLEAGR